MPDVVIDAMVSKTIGGELPFGRSEAVAGGPAPAPNKQVGEQGNDAAPPRRKKKRVRKYGVVPPPTFDFDRLPDSAWLRTSEVAAVLRKAKGTVASWRYRPGHALRWEMVNKTPLYRVGALRYYIAIEK